MAQPRRNDFLIPTLGVLFDSIAIEAAFLFSYWIRFNTSVFKFLPLSEEIPPLDAYIYGSFVVIPVWLLIFNSRDMYSARRNVELADEFFDIVKLVTIGMLVVMSGAFFYRAFSYSRFVFGLLWMTSIASIFIGRLFLYQIEKALYRSGRELRNAVIIGSNETANRIFQVLHNHPLLGYKLAGYFADSRCGNGTPLFASNYLGTVNEAPEKLQQEQIELVLTALDHEQHQQLYKLVQDCEGMNVEFMMVPDILELMTSSVSVKEIEGIPFIKLKGLPMTTWGRVLKRTFDFIVALLFLIISSPLFLIIALFIKLDSNGPVFFRQERIGLDGSKFDMLKFRSMKVEAETQSGPVFATADDPRRTKIGGVLRKTSLDELPQLFNVLKGQMSLVGPRPERPYFVDEFKQLVPKYLDRHRVKTGMTGWAQVNGLRGNTSIQERIKYDIYYIENWSLWFDVKILLKTVRALLPTKHVY
jgi:exopolysaccharide biosynthesis polyprenyl glycosylphosphotransferase